VTGVEEGCIPVRVVLVALSAGSVLLTKEKGFIKLPETWVAKGETICSAGSRLARELLGREIKIVAAIWLTERRYPSYHLVFAVEGFIEKDLVGSRENLLLLRLEDALKLVDDPTHRELIAYIVEFKPRPLLVCSI